MNLNSMSTQALVELHNELYPNRKLSGWKNKKDRLVGLIKARALVMGKSREPNLIDGRGKIKALSEHLLSEIVSYDENGNAVGRPYEEIMEIIIKKIPEAKPSIRSLQWYASKMNVENPLPIRPRKNARHSV